MTVKASISLTDEQERFARGLVETGRFSSLSAVLQQGLDLLREETEAREAELAALRALIESRRRGPFIDVEGEGEERTRAMLAARRAALGSV